MKKVYEKAEIKSQKINLDDVIATSLNKVDLGELGDDVNEVF